MAGAFSRSWEITKLSFNVIKADKELLLFPLFAGIFSILFMIAMVFPTALISLLQAGDYGDATGLLLMFLIYLGLAFIATFFNVCVVYTTKKRFEGGNATFFESINYSLSKIHLIFSWSLLSATVGLILRILDRIAEKTGGIGKIVLMILNSILGLVWSVITIFVVPGMVYNNLGPIDAIKKSTSTLKKTWGESLIRHLGLGIVQFLFIILGVVLTILLVILTSSLGAGAVLPVIFLAVLYFLTVILVFAVANSIFNTALYVYADTGKIPGGFSKDIMQGAFTNTKKGI